MFNLTSNQTETLNGALNILTKVMEQSPAYSSQSMVIKSTSAVKMYLETLLSLEEKEIFVVLFLDTKHHLLSAEKMFHGSIKSVMVHVREIMKRALALNAEALILAHNHPSGSLSPSCADREITNQIVEAGKLFEMRVLDHIIVGHGKSIAFSERGLI